VREPSNVVAHPLAKFVLVLFDFVSIDDIPQTKFGASIIILSP